MIIQIRTADDKETLYESDTDKIPVPREGEYVQWPEQGSGQVVIVTHNYRIGVIFVFVRVSKSLQDGSTR